MFDAERLFWAAAIHVSGYNFLPIVEHIMSPAVVSAGRFTHYQGKDIGQFFYRGPSIKSPFEMLEYAGFGAALDRQSEADELVGFLIDGALLLVEIVHLI